ncbi:MAG TPA: outer membrane lipoprotein carrier protein LolA [Candidatus Aminicenantes bacterium]|nr:outer membrane lipoprotein carrier protein LolA [Candidatus Aminicenantes bacterium]
MGPRRSPALLALLLLLLPASRPAGAASPGAEEFMRRVRAAILDSQPFRVDFVQQVFLDGELEMEESGEIVFADRGRVKWEYRRPESKLFLLEGGRYQYYDREANQLTRGTVGEGQQRLIWELLLAERPGAAVSWEPGQRLVRLRLDAGAGGEEGQELKVFVGADFLPRRVEQSGADQVTTVYRLERYRRRVALQAGDLSLQVPADAEVVEDPLP